MRFSHFWRARKQTVCSKKYLLADEKWLCGLARARPPSGRFVLKNDYNQLIPSPAIFKVGRIHHPCAWVNSYRENDGGAETFIFKLGERKL